MVFCTKCGRENVNGSEFCYSCGAKLTQTDIMGEDNRQTISNSNKNINYQHAEYTEKLSYNGNKPQKKSKYSVISHYLFIVSWVGIAISLTMSLILLLWCILH